MEFPNKKYNIIYADPPWRFNMRKDKRGIHFVKYATMTTDDICNLPVNKITDDNCICFMWMVFPMIREGLRVMEAWGFIPKTVGFTWGKLYSNGKPFMGMGNWTRSNSEFCYIGVKGKPKRLNAGVRSLILSVPETHSKKPNRVRDDIVKLCGDIPRIELFARRKTDGWTCIGDEVEKNI